MPGDRLVNAIAAAVRDGPYQATPGQIALFLERPLRIWLYARSFDAHTTWLTTFLLNGGHRDFISLNNADPLSFIFNVIAQQILNDPSQAETVLANLQQSTRELEQTRGLVREDLEAAFQDTAERVRSALWRMRRVRFADDNGAGVGDGPPSAPRPFERTPDLLNALMEAVLKVLNRQVAIFPEADERASWGEFLTELNVAIDDARNASTDAVKNASTMDVLYIIENAFVVNRPLELRVAFDTWVPQFEEYMNRGRPAVDTGAGAVAGGPSAYRPRPPTPPARPAPARPVPAAAPIPPAPAAPVSAPASAFVRPASRPTSRPARAAASLPAPPEPYVPPPARRWPEPRFRLGWPGAPPLWSPPTPPAHIVASPWGYWRAPPPLPLPLPVLAAPPPRPPPPPLHMTYAGGADPLVSFGW